MFQCLRGNMTVSFVSTKIDAAFLSSFPPSFSHFILLSLFLPLPLSLISSPFLPLPPPLPQALAVGQKLPVSTFNFNHIQCILYALGVGMSTKDPDHLRYVSLSSNKLWGGEHGGGGIYHHV